MSKVLVTQSKLDTLAGIIGGKSSTEVPLTLDEMITAADSITSGGGTPTLQTKSETYTPTTSQQTDTITADAGYDGLDEVDITVNAVPTMTLPSSASSTSSGTSKATITPTSSAQYLNIPTGYNGTAQYYTIAASGGGGGASNFVTGTFTTGDTASANETVTVPYTGSGYPIALVIFVEGGCYNSAISPWYSSMIRWAVGQVVITKANTTTAPSYTTSGGENQGTIQLLFKNSTTSATSYSSTRSATANSYSSTNANGTSTTSVRWRSNTLISYRTAGGTSSTYGLHTETTYRYYVLYSS